MHYSIFLAIAALILIPAIGLTSFSQVTISFHDGKYSPSIVSALGGKVLAELPKVGMVEAVIPLVTIPLLEINNGVDFIERDSQVSIVEEGSGSSVNAGYVSSNIEQSTDWGIPAVGAIGAHQQGVLGKGVKIAVLDTGIDYKHPDLAPNYHGGYNFVNNNNDPMDDNGHGTHVAGIIAASVNNRGVVGVAPEASLYAVKISDSSGKGTFSLLVQGIDWAIQNHMNVITMSITGSDGSEALAKAVETAHDKYGIVLVAAVGNGSGGGVLYPAEYGPVIGVGSVNKDLSLSSFSLTGSKVEIVAPGSSITSTWPGGQYRVLSGTSMATPFVTGAVALILASNEKTWSASGLTNGDGKWTPDEVRNVLDHMTKHLGTQGRNDHFGYGLLQLNFPRENASATTEAANLEIHQSLDQIHAVRSVSFPILYSSFLS